ncbi:glycosyltransferase family 4 protein [Streptomyces sp. NPDC002814]
MAGIAVWWSGPLEDQTGYAVEGRLLVRGLRQHGVAVNARSVQRELLVAEMEETDRIPSPAVFDDVDLSDRIHVVHAGWADPFPPAPAAGRTIWRTMFETDSLPDDWVARSREVDEIWVPTQHNVTTFSRSGVSHEKLRVLHEPLDAAKFSPTTCHSFEESAESDYFMFLSVFTWQLRKGWDVLLRAYFEEFNSSDHVLLILRAEVFPFGDSSPVSIVDEIERLRLDVGGRNTAPVRVIDTHVGDRELLGLYASADTFVLPSRGEGWGRPIMEAMAVGVPVITTGWGGPTEFAHSNSVHLLEYDLTSVSSRAEREYRLFAGHCWAEPSLSHLKREMRAAVTAGKGIRDKESAASVRRSFDYMHVTRRALEYLENPLSSA